MKTNRKPRMTISFNLNELRRVFAGLQYDNDCYLYKKIDTSLRRLETRARAWRRA